MVAPAYVEPGTEGDTLGVEGRHRANMQRIFAYMAHLEKVVNNHADIADDTSHENGVMEKASREQMLEIKTMKNEIIKADAEMKGVIEANDAVVKANAAASFQRVWTFWPRITSALWACSLTRTPP
jgi:hypothetical protein